MASRTRPLAATTTSALDATSNTRRVRSSPMAATGSGATNSGVCRPSVSTMAAVEPVIWPSSFSIGMAVTETSIFLRVAGLDIRWWKPLTVWPRSARALGRRSGGTGRPSGKVMPQVAEWKRRPISSASRRPRSWCAARLAKTNLPCLSVSTKATGMAFRVSNSRFWESSATRWIRSSWPEASTCCPRFLTANHSATSPISQPTAATAPSTHIQLIWPSRNIRPDCPVLAPMRPFGRYLANGEPQRPPFAPKAT